MPAFTQALAQMEGNDSGVTCLAMLSGLSTGDVIKVTHPPKPRTIYTAHMMTAEQIIPAGALLKIEWQEDHWEKFTKWEHVPDLAMLMIEEYRFAVFDRMDPRLPHIHFTESNRRLWVNLKEAPLFKPKMVLGVGQVFRAVTPAWYTDQSSTL